MICKIVTYLQPSVFSPWCENLNNQPNLGVCSCVLTKRESWALLPVLKIQSHVYFETKVAKYLAVDGPDEPRKEMLGQYFCSIVATDLKILKVPPSSL